MRIIIATLAIMAAGCSTVQTRPLCRHIVLSQYAAFKDAGYETEIWHMKNKNPAQSGGFKYHAAVRVKQNGKWLWVQQPKITFTTTTEQPYGTKLLKELCFDTVVKWTETVKNTGDRKYAIGRLVK